jgi:hypothetical protein
MEQAAAEADARTARRWGITEHWSRAHGHVGVGLVSDAGTDHGAAGTLTD